MMMESLLSGGDVHEVGSGGLRKGIKQLMWFFL